MEDDTKTALTDMGNRLDALEGALKARVDDAVNNMMGRLEGIEHTHADIQTALSNPAVPAASTTLGAVAADAETSGFAAGMDRLAVRTLAEARAVLDEYYLPFLNKVRGELGLPHPEPAPVAQPATLLAKG